GFSGTPGGTWSAVPAGLVINTATGEVDLVTSQPGAYTVTYAVDPTAICAGFSTDASIVIRSVYYSQQSGDLTDEIWDMVTAGIAGPATFTPYTTMVVQAGHTVVNTAGVSVDDLVVLGTLSLDE